jgi:SAM-dependent methyltransferase
LTEYEGFFAEFYDILHGHAYEADHYVRFAEESGGTALELGCGTGRLLLPLARAGITVTGIDDADDMLARCRAKLAAEPEEVRARATLVKADLRDFALDDRYGLIFIACNTAQHLLTTEDAVACFRRVREHLAEDGRFVVDFSVPDFPGMVEANGGEEVTEYVHPETGLQIVCRFRADYDFLAQRERNVIHLAEYDGEAVVREATAEAEMTWFLPREFRTLLGLAGLEVVAEYGSQKRTPLGPESREMIFVARPGVSTAG